MKLLLNDGSKEKTLAARASERPDIRERAMQDGLERISNQELVMLILGSGTKSRCVQNLARDVVEELDGYNDETLVSRLLQIDGIGTSKAFAVAAAIELGRRLTHANGIRISDPADLYSLVKNYSLKKQEHFLSVMLNSLHEIQKIEVVSIGTVNHAAVHPREVFAEAISERSSGIIVCHNHPSGSLQPSPDDIAVTDRLCAAGKIIGIRVLDHLIIATGGYYSFAEEGMMPEL